MRKDKTYELRIEEDDELSGIDSISLVSEPAIEINWVAFNKVKPQEFHIPDGEDKKYLQFFEQKGHSEEELFKDGWVRYKEEFVSSAPNEPSFEDTDEYLVRYKYVKNPEAPGSAVKETTREFCSDLISKNYVYRIEDMDSIINDQGDSALVWRGGYNCRHKWMQIRYKRDATIVNKGSVTRGRIDGDESYDVIGYPQPDTRTSNPSFSKQGFEEGCPIATQDVEVNLRNRQKAIVKAHYGPLNPNEPNEEYWEKKAKMFGGDLESAKKARCGNCAFFVQTKKILDCIEDGIGGGEDPEMIIDAGELGYCEAFDFKCAAARTCDAWVVGGPITDEDMGYDVGTITGYVDEGIKKKKKKEQLQSYTDYPLAATENAKRALDWAEKNGWGDCGTAVGKMRANQLASRQSITEETISRMASFARHRQNKDVPYDKGCGGLMWDAWGGTEGIEWASRKLERIRTEQNMSSQKFQTDDEKRIVIGAAMVPDLLIYRQKKNGDPYYVMFKEDTIRMIAEKYMRNKYIDNNDTEHNGKAAEDVYVIESWIKEDEEDKSTKYGFGDLPIGTWFVAMKVRNDEVWKRIKAKELNGFSVSGWFSEIEQFYKEQEFLKEVAKILKDL